MKVWWISIPVVCFVGSALAQVPTSRPGGYYICKDANNRTITSDTPPPECANREIREYGRDGTLRRVIEPPLTAEQRKQREEQAKIKADEEAARAAAKRRDTVLMLTGCINSGSGTNERPEKRAWGRPKSGQRVSEKKSRKASTFQFAKQPR
jgi:hypothetical protein